MLTLVNITQKNIKINTYKKIGAIYMSLIKKYEDNMNVVSEQVRKYREKLFRF